MAKKALVDQIIKLYSDLGGNISNVLGKRSNITFLGKGKTPEGFIDSDINIDAIGVLGKSKILEELESPMGYLTADKLNDVQAGKLKENLLKIKEVFDPEQIPNITDLRTGTRDLTQEGLGALRAKGDYMTDEGVMASETILPMRNVRAGSRQMTDDEYAAFVDELGGEERLEAYTFDGTIKDAQRILAEDKAFTDEMFAQYKAGKLDPQPGERGRKEFLQKKLDEMEASGDKRLLTRDEIEELSDLELEQYGKNLADSMSDAEIQLRSNFPTASDDQIKQMLKTGLNIDDLPPPGSRGGPDDIAAPFQSADETISNLREMPAKRASAREFLVEALKRDETDVGTAAFGKTNLNNVISAEDVKYITEGGGGIGGDPIVLVEKYFGPRIAEAVPVNASTEEIVIFTNRVLNNVEDAAGLKPDNPRFDKFTARFIDEVQDFADGGRVGLRFGRAAGKAFGLFKKQQALEKGITKGYADMRKYGIEGEDITNMFKEISMDPTLVGAEKTEYFKVLNQALKNPNQFPDTIKEIQMKLGIEVGTGFKSGGLAKILEV